MGRALPRALRARPFLTCNPRLLAFGLGSDLHTGTSRLQSRRLAVGEDLNNIYPDMSPVTASRSAEGSPSARISTRAWRRRRRSPGRQRRRFRRRRGSQHPRQHHQARCHPRAAPAVRRRRGSQRAAVVLLNRSGVRSANGSPTARISNAYALRKYACGGDGQRRQFVVGEDLNGKYYTMQSGIPGSADRSPSARISTTGSRSTSCT